MRAVISYTLMIYAVFNERFFQIGVFKQTAGNAVINSVISRRPYFCFKSFAVDCNKPRRSFLFSAFHNAVNIVADN